MRCAFYREGGSKKKFDYERNDSHENEFRVNRLVMEKIKGMLKTEIGGGYDLFTSSRMFLMIILYRRRTNEW